MTCAICGGLDFADLSEKWCEMCGPFHMHLSQEFMSPGRKNFLLKDKSFYCLAGPPSNMTGVVGMVGSMALVKSGGYLPPYWAIAHLHTVLESG
jgi:hypothetical protein